MPGAVGRSQTLDDLLRWMQTKKKETAPTYKLNNMQADILLRMLKGKTLDEQAEILGITKNASAASEQKYTEREEAMRRISTGKPHGLGVSEYTDDLRQADMMFLGLASKSSSRGTDNKPSPAGGENLNQAAIRLLKESTDLVGDQQSLKTRMERSKFKDKDPEYKTLQNALQYADTQYHAKQDTSAFIPVYQKYATDFGIQTLEQGNQLYENGKSILLEWMKNTKGKTEAQIYEYTKALNDTHGINLYKIFEFIQDRDDATKRQPDK